MKKAIAMRCTREQFEAIAPILNKNKLSVTGIGDFDIYKYLTNNIECSGKISNITKTASRKNIYEHYGTWNENIFLDACGIKIEKPIRTNKLTELEKRVAILEHKVDLKKIADMPFNPELKQPFSGKKYEYILKAIKDGKIVIPKTTNIIEEFKNHKPMSLNFGLDFGYGFMQPHISDSLGIYDQYLSLKQENNKLKLRIEELEAENKAILSAPNSAAISFTASSTFDFKDMPIAGTDVKELEVGKWYKNKDHGYENVLGHCSKIIMHDEFYGYGFDTEGNWNNYQEEQEFGSNDNWREATEQEVTEALTKEAVKRGFKEGVAVEYPWFSQLNKQHNIYTPDFKEESVLENERFLYLGCCVFCGGQWAEIIPTISKEDAEKELGKKII